jgi:hypothetical protein
MYLDGVSVCLFAFRSRLGVRDIETRHSASDELSRRARSQYHWWLGDEKRSSGLMWTMKTAQQESHLVNIAHRFESRIPLGEDNRGAILSPGSSKSFVSTTVESRAFISTISTTKRKSSQWQGMSELPRHVT